MPAMRETWVQSLGQEDSLEKEMATSTLSWRILWTEEPGQLQYIGLQRGKESDTIEQLTFTFTSQKAENFILDSRNGMDLTEAEDIKKRWQKYTE